MDVPRSSPRALVSQLEPDSELLELLAPYIAELPSRAAALETSLERRDWPALATLAHRLKGTAGSFGFPLITDAARELEDAVAAERALDSVRELVQAVADLCRRAEAAIPGARGGEDDARADRQCGADRPIDDRR
jgi:HPt (histidine-containing phosphotransfer) domain-containing protein